MKIINGITVEQYIMNAYTETETETETEAEPMMDHNQDDQDNLMPGWLWLMSMVLMPAATGLMTGLLENGWLPETFRIMLSNTEETDNNVEKAE